MTEKVMSTKEAIQEFVHDGDMIAVAGFTGNGGSVALAFEVCRQQKKHLHLVNASGEDIPSYLIGCGCLDKVESGYCALELLGTDGFFRRAMVDGYPHKLQWEDFTNLTGIARFAAGFFGSPFIPVTSLLGSDILNKRTFRGDKKCIESTDPFTGEKVVLLPALNPDVGLIHVQFADKDGNLVFWGNTGEEPFMMNSCKKVIATCEEIVSTDTITRLSDLVRVPGFKVAAVVEEPWAGHPYNLIGYYDHDHEFRAVFRALSMERETAEGWLDEWIFEPKTRHDYIKHYMEHPDFGWDKLQALKLKTHYSLPVNIGKCETPHPYHKAMIEGTALAMPRGKTTKCAKISRRAEPMFKEVKRR